VVCTRQERRGRLTCGAAFRRPTLSLGQGQQSSRRRRGISVDEALAKAAPPARNSNRTPIQVAEVTVSFPLSRSSPPPPDAAELEA